MVTNTESEASNRSRWYKLAGLVAIPVYVIPVGGWGLRALRPRVLRDFASGAVLLGMVALVNMAFFGLSRPKTAARPAGAAKFRRSFTGSILPDEFAASAASAH